MPYADYAHDTPLLITLRYADIRRHDYCASIVFASPPLLRYARRHRYFPLLSYADTDYAYSSAMLMPRRYADAALTCRRYDTL